MLTIMERKKGESARDYVTRVLIDNIVNVHLEPGEKLLENDLSGQLGVSRTPYREAVLALAERQLVHIRPKKGTYVPYIDLKLVEEVRHLRSIVETELAVMACDLLTEEDLDVLRENIAIWKMTRNFTGISMRCATGITGIRFWRACRRILTARRC